MTESVIHWLEPVEVNVCHGCSTFSWFVPCQHGCEQVERRGAVQTRRELID